jgi:carbon-monoxide dehydrogenase small subunit
MTVIDLTINGKTVRAEVEPRTSLADFLRHDQRLTGTHIGCEHGVCGTCTVMINDAPARSCIAFAAALNGCDIRTIEGFETDPVMEKLREAFRVEHGVQCGFCTSGMLITSRDIVTRMAIADEKRIRAELAGNLCRCTGYVGIVNSIQRVMREVPAEIRHGKDRPNPPTPGVTRPFRNFTARAEAQSRTATLSASVDSASAKGWSCITDHFIIAARRPEVWALFADIPRVARCMPGAELVVNDGGNLKGNLHVAFGPIKTRFTGAATAERDDAIFVGILRGGGNDERGGSRAKGRVSYRLVDERAGSSTRVEVSLEYQLQGPLAQFGRSGLVKDFARRLIAQFARNLSDDLTGKPVAAEAAPIKAGAMLWSLLRDRSKSWIGR